MCGVEPVRRVRFNLPCSRLSTVSSPAFPLDDIQSFQTDPARRHRCALDLPPCRNRKPVARPSASHARRHHRPSPFYLIASPAPSAILVFEVIVQGRVLCKMVLCQGLSAGHAQLLAFPVAKHNASFLRRSSLRTPPGSVNLKGAQLKFERKNFSVRAVRAGIDFLQHDMFTSFPRESSVKGIPSLLTQRNKRQRSEVGCRASSLASFSYPELTSKPRWWWRTLACVPYLLPLHNMWSYADVIYQLHTYLQGFSLVYTFIDTMTLLPGWLLLVIFMTVYFFVVRRKWSPHFMRFHVILAILLDTGSQAVATMCTWMPSIVYQGKPMQYFWMAVAFIQIFTVLECMRCALAGMYPNVPFISHTAFIHSDLNLFR